MIGIKNPQGKGVSLLSQIKKIVGVMIFLGVLPLILSVTGTDVINVCPTYSLSDYHIAQSNGDDAITGDMVGQCKEIHSENPNVDTIDTSVAYVRDTYIVIVIMLVVLLVGIVGFNVFKY